MATNSSNLTPEQIRLLQQQNDLYRKQLELQAEGYSLSTSYLESLKEVMGIRSRTSVSDGNILDINKKINKSIYEQKGIYDKSSDIQKQILKNKHLIHGASVQELSLSNQLSVKERQKIENTSKSLKNLENLNKLLDIELAKTKEEQEFNKFGIENIKDQIKAKEKYIDSQVRSMSQSAKTLLYTKKQKEELEKQNVLRKDEADKLKQVEKTLGISGALMKGMSKIPFLGDLPGMSSVLDDVEEEIKAINEARKLEGKEPVSRAEALRMTFSKMKGVIKDVLTDPAALGAIAFKLMVEALEGADKGAGDLAKGFNMTYNEAMNVREELTQIGNLSGDVALNTRALQESMMAVGQALGSNAMLNEKDLVTFTKLREQAGFTNDELLGIQKTTLATGGNLEKNAKNILFSAKLTGLNNKVLLNEKDIMRDVAKASDAIKLSLGGSGKKLGEAAAQAKALGMSLEQVDKIAGSLLDFESSITNELSAELITGKQINLEQARLYALNNDMAGLSREIAKNFGSVAEFGKMNRIQQEAAAKAVGMSREELATTLTDQAALKGLSGDKLKDAQAALDYARAQGMTEDQIAQQGVDNLMKQQSVQERLNNSVEKMKEVFMGIAEPIMQIISPLMDLVNLILPAINLLLSPLIEGFSYIGKLVGWISTGISSFSDWLKKGSAAATALKIILYPIMGIVAAIAAAMIYSALSAIPIVGPFLAPIAVVGLIGMIAKAASAKPAPMAKGGIIPATPGGTLIQAGEAGKAEAIIPLDNSGGFNIKTSSPPQQRQQQQPPIDYSKFAGEMAKAMSSQPIHVSSTVDGNVLTQAVANRATPLGNTLTKNVYKTA